MHPIPSPVALKVFESKVLSQIFGLLQVDDDFCSSEQYDLNDIDVAQRINIFRLRWLGHIARVEEDSLVR